MSRYKNIQVIAFLDCCRTLINEEEPTGQGVNVPGELFIGFGCQPGKIALMNKDGARYTKKLVDYLFKKLAEEQLNVQLPKDLTMIEGLEAMRFDHIQKGGRNFMILGELPDKE